MTVEGWSTVVLSPASVVSANLGPLLTGVMIAHLLLGVVCSQAARYFHHYFRVDGQFIRSIVTSLLILNILLGIMDFMTVYQIVVLSFGDFEKFDLQPREWTTWGETAVTALVALIAHIFYIHRCWALIRSLPVFIFLSLVALLAFSSAITTTVLRFMLGRLSKMTEAIIPGTVWFISTCICDISIATILALYFWRNSSAVRSTHAMFSRLQRISIETGSLTAICALLNLILFAALAPAAYYLLIQYSMSHIYTLSVFYTLLSRQDLRDVISTRAGATGLGQSPLFTSILSYSVYSRSIIPHHIRNTQMEDSSCHSDDPAENSNAIPIHHIRNRNN